MISQLRDLGATVYPEPIALDRFQLSDHAGNAFGRENLDGFWTLMFFGYTSCPDICPLTMTELDQFYEGLENSALKDRLRIVMVTVDPDRDTTETMAAYVGSFNPGFIGLNGDKDSIANLASQLFVAYDQASAHADHDEHGVQPLPTEPGEYLIEHNGHIAVINPAGEYYAVLRAPHRDRDIARALETITRL